MRRDQVPRGAAYSHPTSPRHGPHYLALGKDDVGLIGETVDPRKMWSVSLSGDSVVSLWCYVDTDCHIYPPDMWKPHVWEFVHATVEGLAKLGVRVTPMCVRLYREGGGVG